MKYTGVAKVTDQVIRNMEETQLAPRSPSSPTKIFKNQKRGVVIVLPKEKLLYITSGYHFNNKMYWSALPHPVTLFFQIALENANIAQDLFKNFIELKDESNSIQTKQELYDAFIKHRFIAVIQLQAGIEGFLNFAIPDNAKVEVREKDGVVQYDKQTLEFILPFKEKLDLMKTFYSTNISNAPDFKAIRDTILRVNRVRKKLVHLRTSRQPNNMSKFYDSFDEAIALDIIAAIQKGIEFVNIIHPNFIEVEEQKYPMQMLLKNHDTHYVIYNYTTDYHIGINSTFSEESDKAEQGGL